MLEKLQKVLKLLIIFFLAVGIIYFFIMYIANNAIKNDTKTIDNLLSDENINIYIDEEKLITDYSAFFNMEEIIDEVIEFINTEKYIELYEICDINIKNTYSKAVFEDKLANYVKKNFSKANGYSNNNNLEYLYSIGNSEYIAVVKTLEGTTNIGIKYGNSIYRITYLEL